jgi:hypothetical protein
LGDLARVLEIYPVEKYSEDLRVCFSEAKYLYPVLGAVLAECLFENSGVWRQETFLDDDHFFSFAYAKFYVVIAEHY